ncbi:Uncharacterised protein [Bordetella pertussis]|nr:Uncharacterised protein [Bordetella pertussis]
MVAGQAVAQRGFAVGAQRHRDVGDGNVLDVDVRRGYRDPGHGVRAQGGIEQRNAGAVAVAEQDRLVAPRVDAQRREQRGQGLRGLLVQVVDGPALIQRTDGRAAVAVARINQPAASGRIADAPRPVAPHGQRPQPFVQEYQQGGIAPLRREQRILDAHGTVGVMHVGVLRGRGGGRAGGRRHGRVFRC